CVRNYMGPGTVGVFFMRDEDDNPVPDAGEVAEVKAYIEERRPVTAEVYVQAPVIVPVVYQIRLDPDTTIVRNAVEAQLADLHKREAGLGETLLISHMREAISGSKGERDHELVSPAADVVPTANQLLTYGGCVWLA
ncbi:baseplate J/gp47 family protein, partial [Pseudomonas taiwanensis]|uniref:baseplate J/gp47 family protein n=1 Tax=Pseudomonas taiwanensis TaxID=470150 RepID=UPI00164609D3